MVNWGTTLEHMTPGPIEHSFILPNELLGKPNVFVKLAAHSNQCATQTGGDNGVITPDMGNVNVRIGVVTFKYVN